MMFLLSMENCFTHMTSEATYTNMFIKDVPKNINNNLGRRLTPSLASLVLALLLYWYMDDGALKWAGHSNAMRICTESFSENGVLLLKQALKDLYNIETNLVRKTTKSCFVGNRLAINEKNASAFRELIKPHLVDCMRYKVSDGQKGRLLDKF
jgi:LAGLIDADG DNA endonuclease family